MAWGEMPPPDARFDVTAFGLDADLARSGIGDVLRAGSHAPSIAFASLWWWMTGRRLRAQNRIRAVAGDRLKPNGQHLSLVVGDGIQPGPGFAVCRLISGERALLPAQQGANGIVLLVGEDCRVAPAARDWFQTLFALEPRIMAATCDALVLRAGAPPVPLLANQFDADAFMAIAPVAPVMAVRAGVLAEIGESDVELVGSEIADLLLRISARHGEASIGHVPEILVGWEQPAGPPRLAPGSIRAARLETARRHLERTGRKADCALDEHGVVQIATELPDPPPRVSVIIPTKDRVDLLRGSVEGILHRTNYPDIEIIVVDNGSNEPATHDYFAQISKDSRMRILAAPGPFNYAALNNRAAAVANGHVLLLLNNDVSTISPDWLRLMVAEAMRPEIGAVGAKLLYPGGLVQHAGIVLGLGGAAQHAHQFYPGDHRGYMHRLSFPHRWSAVTAACLAVEKAKFDQVGGFDEDRFPVALNDVDLCLSLEKRGFHSLLVPRAILLHHESATRAPASASGQRQRWQKELLELSRKWEERIENDTYYSVRLGAASPDFSLPNASEEVN